MAVKYGLLGHPLGHSFSRAFHNERFQRLGIDAVYENYDLADVNDLMMVLASEPQLRGLNVTIPYKQDVMRFLDELDPIAAEIGAVNCIKIDVKNNGKTGSWLKGYNTDIIGFVESIRPLLDTSNKNALILGTGGVSKAVLAGLRNLGIEATFVSRTKGEGRLSYEELSEEILREHTVIVNCSPIGMPPNENSCPNIPYQFLSNQHVCFDCVYIPEEETLFVKKAKKFGAKAKSGYEMLVGQAIASYEIWK